MDEDNIIEIIESYQKKINIRNLKAFLIEFEDIRNNMINEFGEVEFGELIDFMQWSGISDYEKFFTGEKPKNNTEKKFILMMIMLLRLTDQLQNNYYCRDKDITRFLKELNLSSD